LNVLNANDPPQAINEINIKNSPMKSNIALKKEICNLIKNFSYPKYFFILHLCSISFRFFLSRLYSPGKCKIIGISSGGKLKEFS